MTRSRGRAGVAEGRFFTAANVISLVRIPLGAAASYFIVRVMPLPAGIFVFAAIASDWLDGFVARRTGTVSDWGRILDPLADKIAFALFAWALVHTGALRLWVLLVLLSRDVLIGVGGLFIAKRLKPPSARPLGKLSTVLMALFLTRQAFFPTAVLGPQVLPGADLLGAAAMVLVITSFIDYLAAFPGLYRTESRRCA
ncbi:MAG: CDP-alcohol phosphatidyltransferase family protein [Candidatus Fermentibacteraceae bacterium]